ncbi:uncharacterized protein V1518DRAFT_410514 [Limtongia smithiae]|uniref:uncharacterized protein n=1 Tax=Limtongia smithiae TaxID=1125753 RepID=UPI0034CEA689
MTEIATAADDAAADTTQVAASTSPVCGWIVRYDVRQSGSSHGLPQQGTNDADPTNPADSEEIVNSIEILVKNVDGNEDHILSSAPALAPEADLDAPSSTASTTTMPAQLIIEDAACGTGAAEKTAVPMVVDTIDPTAAAQTTTSAGNAAGVPGETDQATIVATTPAPPTSPRPDLRESLKSSVFKVRAITWHDPRGVSRTSAVVMQNNNGPCPLLALVNTLLLSTPPNKLADSALSRVSPHRGNGNISAAMLVDILADVLLSSTLAPAPDSADTTRVLSLLPSLHTGMNINPRFDGTFAPSDELALFRAFDVDVVHGWVFDDEAYRYMRDAVAAADSYEGAQSLLVAAAETTARLQTPAVAPATADELQTIEFARLIEDFLSQTASQLTACGLKFLGELLAPGSIAVFFRNDHFSTIYKHPDSKQLFTLVTDAGYNSHANIVWESLNDVSGSSSLFFDGMFAPSEFTFAEPAAMETRAAADAATSDDKYSLFSADDASVITGTTTGNTGSVDDDYALAAELQRREDMAIAQMMQTQINEQNERRAQPSSLSRSRQRSGHDGGSSGGTPHEIRQEHARRQRRQEAASNSGQPIGLYSHHGQAAGALLGELQASSRRVQPPSSSSSRRPQARPLAATTGSSSKEKCVVM